MPRRSTAAMSVVPMTKAGRSRLAPSAGAPDEVKELFGQIVAAAPQDHFVVGDAPLIEQYAQSIALARRAYTELAERGPVIDGRQSPWLVAFEKANRASVALSARLRLAPQSRSDARSAARRAGGPTPSIYAQMGGDDDEA